MADSIAKLNVIVGAECGELLDGMKQSTAAIDRFHQANGRAAASFQEGSKAASRFGVVTAAAGMQAQDLAVQLAGGQNALVALAQQGSQLLGVFGTGGAIAGAVLAVGALTLKFTEMGSSLQSSKEFLDELDRSLNKVIESTNRLKEVRAKSFEEGLQPTDLVDFYKRQIEYYKKVQSEGYKQVRKGTEAIQLAGTMGFLDRVKTEITGPEVVSAGILGDVGAKLVLDSQNKINEAKTKEIELSKKLNDATDKLDESRRKSAYKYAKSEYDFQIKLQKDASSAIGKMFSEDEAIKDRILKKIDPLYSLRKDYFDIMRSGLEPEQQKIAIDSLVGPASIPQSMQVNAAPSALGGTYGDGAAVLDIQREVLKVAQQQRDALVHMIQMWSTGSN